MNCRCSLQVTDAMPSNAFIGKKTEPTAAELTAALSKKNRLWDELLKELATRYELVDHDWNSYSPKAGWALRIRRKDRNILYLSPSHGAFQASIILGDKAIAEARKAGLSPIVARLIKAAKRYPEGNAIRLKVASPSEVDFILELVGIKLLG